MGLKHLKLNPENIPNTGKVTTNKHFTTLAVRPINKAEKTKFQ